MSEKIAQLIVVGAGPAGLAAAATAASEGIDTVLIERSNFLGGQQRHSRILRNYPGIWRCTGSELVKEMAAQCDAFGVRMRVGYDVHRAGGSLSTARAAVWAKGEDIWTADAVILAHGMQQPRQFGSLPNVAYGLNTSPLAYGAKAVVVGGGNSAGQAALWLSRFTWFVTIITPHPLKDTMSAFLREEIDASEHVWPVYGRVKHIEPAGESVRLILRDRPVPVKADHVSVFTGAVPSRISGPEIDRRGFVVTRAENRVQTSEERVFAIGDVRAGSIRRVAACVGDAVDAVQQAMELIP